MRKRKTSEGGGRGARSLLLVLKKTMVHCFPVSLVRPWTQGYEKIQGKEVEKEGGGEKRAEETRAGCLSFSHSDRAPDIN